MSEPKKRHRCPRCHTATALWESVSVAAWQGIDEYLDPDDDRDIDWSHAHREGYGGCGECEWQGSLSQLEVLGTDGEPLPFVHPRQMAIEA